jgi:hypothetical protein
MYGSECSGSRAFGSCKTAIGGEWIGVAGSSRCRMKCRRSDKFWCFISITRSYFVLNCGGLLGDVLSSLFSNCCCWSAMAKVPGAPTTLQLTLWRSAAKEFWTFFLGQPLPPPPTSSFLEQDHQLKSSSAISKPVCEAVDSDVSVEMKSIHSASKTIVTRVLRSFHEAMMT